MGEVDNLRGGKREGAGRKTGSGLYREETAVMRVPVSQKAVIADFLTAYQRKQTFNGLDPIHSIEQPRFDSQPIYLPLFSSKVKAGFPSPADDHVEGRLDVREYLIGQEDATFFVTISGESMRDAGLLGGDKAIVDRSKIAAIGDIVLAVVDGEYTIKTLGKSKQGMPRLIPANPDFPIIEIKDEMQFEIWGVVTGSFRKYK